MAEYSLKPVEMTDRETIYPIRKAKHGDLVSRFGAHVKGGTFNARGELVLFVVVDPADVDYVTPLTKEPGYTFTWNVRKRVRSAKLEADDPSELLVEGMGEEASSNGSSVRHGGPDDGRDPWELIDE